MDYPRPSPEPPGGTAAERQVLAHWRQLQADWRRAVVGGHAPDFAAFIAARLETGAESLRQLLESAGPVGDGDGAESGAEATGAYQTPQPTIDAPPRAPADPERNTDTREYVTADPAATVDEKRGETQGGRDTAADRQGQNAPNLPPPRDAASPAGYELIKVLGRGAMGVVYLARQPGLKRLVALKMILAGEHADSDELARFRVEAEAVAQLQHVNIVQVYEVGELKGRPYLTLEYVDGGSLKDKLAGKPQPVRPAAQLLQVLAEAMDFAHRKGVIHRDLKPGNVMLMAPRPAGSTRTSLHAPSLSEQLYGTPKIADFGLAKRLEEDSGQTRSGTILGTPSYMSPEQAGGQLKQVGPHSDQYALGAILYEMLTGRPPFDGTSVWETIEQVRTREPVPPSRLQPRVPRDLETICLKCLQKEPRQRYADAAALAEDLRRFVANEPILARPVSAPERLWRWCRRNPTIAAPSFTALLLLLAFMAFLMVHNRQLSDFTVQLGAEKKQTEIQRDAANTAREQAEKNERRAEKDRGVALKALGAFVSNVQEELGRRPGQQELQKKLLKIAMGHLGGVSKSTTAKVNLNDSTLAAAHLNLGMVFLRLGETKAGMEELRQAESIYRAIVESAPDDPDGRANQANQAVALRQLGLAHLGQSQTDEAVACFRKAADLMAALEERRAGDKVSVADVKAERANSLDSLGFLASVTRLREARGYYQQALDLRRQVADLRKADGRRWDEARSALARSYLLVGGADFRLRNPASTEELYRDAVALRAELAKAHPANAVVQSELGYARQRLGDFYLRTQRPEAAAPEYEGAEQLYAALVKQDPKRADYQDFLARALGDAGLAALRRGDKALAAKKYHAALAIREARAQVHDDMDVQKGLMMALARCGDHRRAAALAEQIRKRAPDSRDDLYDVACCFGVCAGIEVPAGGSPDERRLRDRYAADAVQALREAINRGHRDVVNVETEPDFDAIRDRADFKALVAELARTAEP